MPTASEIAPLVRHEIQYAAALEILHDLLEKYRIDQTNAQRAAVALAEIFGVLRRSI